MDELTVWVVTTHTGYGEGADVLGVYASREAAFTALKAQPNMTVYVDGNGMLVGRPRKEVSWPGWLPRVYASGEPMKVQGADGGGQHDHGQQAASAG